MAQILYNPQPTQPTAYQPAPTTSQLWAAAREKQASGNWTDADVNKLRTDLATAKGFNSWDALKADTLSNVRKTYTPVAPNTPTRETSSPAANSFGGVTGKASYAPVQPKKVTQFRDVTPAKVEPAKPDAYTYPDMPISKVGIGAYEGLYPQGSLQVPGIEGYDALTYPDNYYNTIPKISAFSPSISLPEKATPAVTNNLPETVPEPYNPRPTWNPTTYGAGSEQEVTPELQALLDLAGANGEPFTDSDLALAKALMYGTTLPTDSYLYQMGWRNVSPGDYPTGFGPEPGLLRRQTPGIEILDENGNGVSFWPYYWGPPTGKARKAMENGWYALDDMYPLEQYGEPFLQQYVKGLQQKGITGITGQNASRYFAVDDNSVNLFAETNKFRSEIMEAVYGAVDKTDRKELLDYLVTMNYISPYDSKRLDFEVDNYLTQQANFELGIGELPKYPYTPDFSYILTGNENPNLGAAGLLGDDMGREAYKNYLSENPGAATAYGGVARFDLNAARSGRSMIGETPQSPTPTGDEQIQYASMLADMNITNNERAWLQYYYSSLFNAWKESNTANFTDFAKDYLNKWDWKTVFNRTPGAKLNTYHTETLAPAARYLTNYQ